VVTAPREEDDGDPKNMGAKLTDDRDDTASCGGADEGEACNLRFWVWMGCGELAGEKILRVTVRGGAGARRRQRGLEGGLEGGRGCGGPTMGAGKEGRSDAHEWWQQAAWPAIERRKNK
jgi:hypothetical protein